MQNYKKTLQNNTKQCNKIHTKNKTKQNKTNQVQKNMQQRFVTSIRCRTGSGSLSPLDIHNGTKAIWYHIQTIHQTNTRANGALVEKTVANTKESKS